MRFGGWGRRPAASLSRPCRAVSRRRRPSRGHAVGRGSWSRWDAAVGAHALPRALVNFGVRPVLWRAVLPPSSRRSLVRVCSVSLPRAGASGRPCGVRSCWSLGLRPGSLPPRLDLRGGAEGTVGGRVQDVLLIFAKQTSKCLKNDLVVNGIKISN